MHFFLRAYTDDLHYTDPCTILYRTISLQHMYILDSDQSLYLLLIEMGTSVPLNAYTQVVRVFIVLHLTKDPLLINLTDLNI